MCGILGTMPAVRPEPFEQALNLLAHRGPDDSGVWSDGVVTLGHRRLSILDVSAAGHQPMSARDGDHVLVFNGEIYNFVELRRELEGRGCRFQSESDSEVLLSAYREWGAQCLSRMNGMWAFAIWEPKRRRLFLARDRFGQKPLFYAWVGNRFVFASEMKAICPFLSNVEHSRHFDWMREHIHEYESTDACLIEGINRFPAGSYGLLEDGRLTVHKYWESLDHLADVPSDYCDQVAHFRELFVDACRIRMRSDVPMGTALSGGVDSGAVVCTLKHIDNHLRGDRISRDWQHAFTASFPGKAMDESALARQVVDHLGIQSTVIPVDPVAAVERIDDYFYAFEELYITNPIPMIETYRAMRQHGVVVSIDGHGADELLSGYAESVFTAYPDCRSMRDVSDVISTYRGLFGASAAFNTRGNLFYWSDYLRRFVLRPRWMRVKRRMRDFIVKCLGETETRRWVGRAKGRGVATERQESERPPSVARNGESRHPAFGGLDHFGRHLYIMFHETSMPTLLRNYDRYAMASGVEIRMPFLDHRLVTYSFSLPWSSKLRDGYTKMILRDAVRDLVPADVLNRRAKTGFGAPPIEWLQHDLRDFILDTVTSRDFRECPVLTDGVALASRTERLIRDPKPMYRDAESLWTEIMAHFWYRAVIKRCGSLPRVV